MNRLPLKDRLRDHPMFDRSGGDVRDPEQETLPLFGGLPEMPMIVDWAKVDSLTGATAVGRLFHLLTDEYWHSSVEISGPVYAGLGYGACLSTLRRMGVIPEHRYHRNMQGESTSYYDYRLSEEFIGLYRARREGGVQECHR